MGKPPALLGVYPLLLIDPADFYNIACIESVCGHADQAIAYLQRAADLYEFNYEWAQKDPDFELIRDDPRFKNIMVE